MVSAQGRLGTEGSATRLCPACACGLIGRCASPWGLTCGQHPVDLADLPEALAAVVLQRGVPVEVHSHGELPGLHLRGTQRAWADAGLAPPHLPGLGTFCRWCWGPSLGRSAPELTPAATPSLLLKIRDRILLCCPVGPGACDPLGTTGVHAEPGTGQGPQHRVIPYVAERLLRSHTQAKLLALQAQGRTA